ncbi:C39 family peptidase [Paenibacillus koleovorans]|uniref:C39 family peptidase n=1 Tax=Paenibacillus koleovorans TaxID=121608 RepID=UPI000FD88195|nr:C39 family peptidase [Paenibacillus koleovorans]
MVQVWNIAKYSFTLLLIAGLLFSSGVFSVLLYAKITGKDVEWFSPPHVEAQPNEIVTPTPEPPAPTPTPEPVKPASAMLDAPVVKQLPELPSGCEITSLTMLLNYYGVAKTKMELVPEMKKDPTAIAYKDNRISYWGNPNVGFVGEVTGKGKGFGIYHGPLMELLQAYVPTAVDMTGGTFDALERQVAAGIPAVVWTTIDYKVPTEWVEWNTASGPVVTTFMEHAVLLVGYDETNVYVNDPLSGRKNMPLNKAAFIQVWEVMGKQALSYK